jgi:protein-disulfide isomerase/uncharacterized membrane protein
MTHLAGREKPLFPIIVALAAVGLAAGVYLTFSHYRILSGQQLEGSFCQISEVVDCDAIAASRYSDFLGIPWSALGSVVYLLVLTLGLLGWAVRDFRILSCRLIVILALFSILLDVYLAIVGFVVLQKVCLVCVLTYVVNIGLLVCSRVSSGETVFASLAGGARDLSALVGRASGQGAIIQRLCVSSAGVVILLSSVIVGVLHWHYSGWSGEMALRVVENLRKQGPVEVDLAGAPRAGSLQPKIRIVEFSDFLCPYCRRMSLVLDIVRKRYPEDVAVFFRHYPLDSECNRFVAKSLHPEACRIAKMSVCADRVGLFWELLPLFFPENPSWQARLEGALRAKGGHLSSLLQCAAEPGTADRVLEDIQLARKHAVDTTPTVFLNGYKLVGYYDPHTLSRIVEMLLASGGRL